jgi:RecB family endonuclease NucS
LVLLIADACRAAGRVVDLVATDDDQQRLFVIEIQVDRDEQEIVEDFLHYVSVAQQVLVPQLRTQPGKQYRIQGVLLVPNATDSLITASKDHGIILYKLSLEPTGQAGVELGEHNLAVQVTRICSAE